MTGPSQPTDGPARRTGDPGSPGFSPAPPPGRSGPDGSRFPGALPPPVAYPGGRRRRTLAAVAVLAVVLVGGAAAAVLTRGAAETVATAAPVSAEAAKTAIQGYLDALSRGDDATVARNASCGFFDALTDKKSDLALANLASDAFRRQFASAQVRSVDQIVTASPTQAQVLFTMDIRGASSRGGPRDLQAVAQILVQDGHNWVCSYLPRAAQY